MIASAVLGPLLALSYARAGDPATVYRENRMFESDHAHRFDFAFSKDVLPGRIPLRGVVCRGITETHRCATVATLYRDWVTERGTFLPTYESCLRAAISNRFESNRSNLGPKTQCDFLHGGLFTYDGLDIVSTEFEYDVDHKKMISHMLPGGECSRPPCYIATHDGYWITKPEILEPLET